MSVRPLLDHLRGGAPRVAFGRFRVDGAKALSKLRDFRLADSADYVLELLRAAVASGATRIDVNLVLADAEIRFDAAFPPDTLRNLFGAALSSGRDEATARARLLAYGVLGALALKPRHIEVESSGVVVRVHPPHDVEVTESSAKGAGTRITLRRAGGWRAVRWLSQPERELKLIRARTPFFPARLVLGGADWRGEEWPVASGFAHRAHAADGREFRVFVAPTVQTPAQLDVIVYGVVVSPSALDVGAVPLVGWVRDDRLRRDASGAKIVTDEKAFLALMEATESLADDRLADLVVALDGPQAEEVRGLLRACAVKVAKGEYKATKRARALLDGAPLLVGPAGEPVRLADVHALAASGKPIRTSTQPWSATLYEPPVVWLGQAPELEATLPAPRQDVEPLVHARLRRDRNRARFEAQAPEAPRLPPLEVVARAAIAAPGMAGEVALPIRPSTALVRFLKGGRLLEHKEVPALLPLRVTAVVDADALQPDETWQGVLVDAAHDAVVGAVRAAAVSAIEEALAAGSAAPALRAHARDALAALLAADQTVPDGLRTAGIYGRAGGGEVSAAELDEADSIRFVSMPWPEPALDGRPVVALDPRHAELWQRRKGIKRVRDVSARLRQEVEIRARQTGPGEPARLPASSLVRVPISAEGVTGELGLRDEGEGGLDVRFLKKGFFLETRRFATAYGRVAAVVDAPALQAAPSWDAVVDGVALHVALAAVREAEPRLIEALVAKMPRATWLELPLEARTYAEAFVRRHFAAPARRGKSDASPVDERLRQAALTGLHLATSRGRLALGAALEAIRAEGHLYVVTPDRVSLAPKEVFVIAADDELATLLGGVSGLKAEPPWEEIERVAARAAFQRLPERKPVLPAEVAHKVTFDAQGFKGELGAGAGDSPGLELEVLHHRRLLTAARHESALPLRAVVEATHDGIDPAALKLTAALEKRMRAVLASAEGRLVEQALGEADAAGPRKLLLFAIAGGHHQRLQALRDRPLFPTTTGEALSFDELAKRKTVAFVTQPLDGAIASGEPVIRAVEPAVIAAVAALGKKRRDVTDALAAQIEARLRRGSVRPVDEVRVPGRPLVRRAFRAEHVEGEAALTSGTSATVSIYHQRRLLVKEPLAAPAGVEIAVNSDLLKPLAKQNGVRHDAAYKQVVALVHDEIGALAADAARAWAPSSRREQERLAPVLARVAGWLLDRGKAPQSLLALPLLASTDGRVLAFEDLVRVQQERGRVPAADREGKLLDERLWVLRPRPGEREGLPKSLRLEDATAALVWADRVRKASPVRSVATDHPGPWREPVIGNGMEGEVVVAKGPLVLELMRGRRLLETASLEHAVGGVARVNCDALAPDPLRARVVRDEAFQAVRAAVDVALERALARALREGRRDDWEGLVDGAMAWRFGHPGPVAEALAALPLFSDAAGAPVTVGRVLAEASGRGHVAVVAPGLTLPAAPSLVLSAGHSDRQRLVRLKVTLEDLSDEARDEQRQRARREERRLPSLRYGGRAILRRSIEEDGWRGELALPDPPDRAAAIVLARDGIAVDQFHAADIGVAGVLEHASLPVAEAWDRALIDDAWRERLHRLVDGLFAQLAEAGPRMNDALRETAAFYALRRLAHAGVAAPAQLDRLTGTDEAVARAPLFTTISREPVDLRTIAARVLRESPVYVLPFGDHGDHRGRFALRALPPGGPWTGALESVLGRGSTRVVTAEEWRRREAEREPEPDDPVAPGIQLLRREVERLRGDAVGQLLRDTLRDVRLHRGAGAPVSYDAQRGLGLLDPDHPAVGRALAEAATDPDALYVLLGALVGAVNRSLEAVTDEDERTLIGALLGRLADGSRS